MTGHRGLELLAGARPRAAEARTVLSEDARAAMLERIMRADRFDDDLPAVAGRRLRARVAVAAVVVAVTAGAIAAPVVLSSSGSRDPGPVLQLDSYRLRLPLSYRLVDSVSAACPAAIVTYHMSAKTPVPPSDPAQPNVVAAASAAGGCVSMLLSSPFRPGSADSPYVPGADGPRATHVAIRGYHAAVAAYEWLGTGNMAGVSEEYLDITVPTPGGQAQDLVFASVGLSRSALVSLVSRNLSS